jgi:hypothetical protein
MGLERRVQQLEKFAGPGPDAITAAVLEGRRVTRVLAGGRWQAAPEGLTPGDLPDGAKVYMNLDVEHV